MKLYSMVPQDCSGKVRWLLLELGIAFEDVKVSYKAGDLKTESYLAKNPIGQVPVLEDGPVTMYESFAIVAYLADKYNDKKLSPDPKALDKRSAYYQWLFFCANTAEGFFTRLQNLPSTTTDYQAQWGTYTHDKVQKVMGAIEKQLQGKDYILGEFSAVDTCMGYAIDSVIEESFVNDYPLTKAYYERLAKREACIKSEIFKRN
jgi:glutathione S-transferase